MDSIWWGFLYCALDVYPLFPLRHVPVMGKLRIPFSKMMLIVTGVVLIQAGVFTYLCAMGANDAQQTLYRQLSMFLYIGVTCLCVKDPIRKILFMDFLMAPLVLFLNFFSYLLGTVFFEEWYNSYLFATDSLLRIVLMIAVYPFMYWFFKQVVKPIMNIKAEKAWDYIWLMPVAFTVLSFVTVRHFLQVTNIYLLAVIRILLCVGCVLSCYVLKQTAEKIVESAVLEEKAKYAGQLLSLQATQYKTIFENIEQTKAARHDLRHHLLVISSLYEQKDYDELGAYLHEYTQALPVESELLVCNHLVVNSLVTQMILHAKERRIDVSCLFNFGNDLYIHDIDLCVLIGNCMENAIEACVRIDEDERFIHTAASLCGGNLSFTIDNSFDGHVEKSGDRFLSLKHSSGEHGVGIDSIAAVVRKYNGVMKLDFDESVFRVSVLLLNHKADEPSPPSSNK